MRYSWNRKRKQWGNAYWCYPYSIKIQAPLMFAIIKHTPLKHTFDTNFDGFEDGTIVRIIKIGENEGNLIAKRIEDGLKQYVLKKDLLPC